MASHALTTVYYVVDREKGRSPAVSGLALGLGDYEDAVQAVACLKTGARFLVTLTRNKRGFKGASVALRPASEVLGLLSGIENR